MHLTVDETKLRNKILNIIKNNDIKDALNKISNLTFENKKVGFNRAKRFCDLYIDNFENKFKKINKKKN